MVLTAEFAVVVAISVCIPAPMFAQGIIAGYFLRIAVGLVMCGPEAVGELGEVYRQRVEVKDVRAVLEGAIVVRMHERDVTRSPGSFLDQKPSTTQSRNA